MISFKRAFSNAVVFGPKHFHFVQFDTKTMLRCLSVDGHLAWFLSTNLVLRKPQVLISLKGKTLWFSNA